MIRVGSGLDELNRLAGVRLEPDEEEQRPRRTPGQAEGVDDESEDERPDSDGLRRERPDQAEGEDPQDEADEVPRED